VHPVGFYCKFDGSHPDVSLGTNDNKKEWGNSWYFILESIYEALNHELEKKCKTPGDKLHRLVQSQKRKTPNDTNFYPRVVNKTNNAFSNDELSLLNKGLIYNLGHKQKYWITNLAFEAETAITLLPAN
jgi:hypothetical protein